MCPETKNELTVQYAKYEDLARINDLRRQVSELHAAGRPDIFRPGFCEELQKRIYALFDRPAYDVIAASMDGTICGFSVVQYAEKPESAYMRALRLYRIEELGVDEGFRRRGVGTALLHFCRSEARRRGFDRLELDVWTFNEAAQRFYEAAGFHPYRCYLESDI